MTSDDRRVDPALDVNLSRVWRGVAGEMWGQHVGPVERGARRLLGSASLARAAVISPTLILAWIIASAAVLAVGVIASISMGQPLVPLLAPAVAIAGVMYAYGPGADVAWEISRTMPVNRTLLLLVRLVIVYAINTALAAAAMLFISAHAAVTMAWLIPMVSLSLLALAIATITGSTTLGGLVAGTCWALLVLLPIPDQRSLPLERIDLGAAVSTASVGQLLPLYLIVIALSAFVILRWQDAPIPHREDTPWTL